MKKKTAMSASVTAELPERDTSIRSNAPLIGVITMKATAATSTSTPASVLQSRMKSRTAAASAVLTSLVVIHMCAPYCAFITSIDVSCGALVLPIMFILIDQANVQGDLPSRALIRATWVCPARPLLVGFGSLGLISLEGQFRVRSFKMRSHSDFPNVSTPLRIDLLDGQKVLERVS